MRARVIRRSGEELLGMIEELLELVKFDAGQVRLQPVEVDLRQFLESLAGIVKVKAEHRGLSFEAEFADDLPATVKLDDKRLRQVLLKLLDDLMKSMSHGCVKLRALCPTAGRLRVEGADQAAAVRQRDREHRDRAGATVIAREDGAVSGAMHEAQQASAAYGGLGVPINRRLVELMGGDIGVESGSHGCGFWLELDVPFTDKQPEPIGTEPMTDAPVHEQRALAPSAPNATSPTPPGQGAAAMLTPPPEQVKELYRLAMIGNMRTIREHVVLLAEQDARLATFAQHVAALAERFESRAIVELIRGLQERDPGQGEPGVSEEAPRPPGAYSDGAAGEEAT
jgi:hypothetical protein